MSELVPALEMRRFAAGNELTTMVGNATVLFGVFLGSLFGIFVNFGGDRLGQILAPRAAD